MTDDSAFRKLSPVLQEKLYRLKWQHLRPIQAAAIHHILGGTGHLVISASTAAGKTEAAFLPILSDILYQPNLSIRSLYVGPLKALINDQFRRLDGLCEESNIPVHRWHGDVGQSGKQHVLRAPSGVLLITPESIESLFVNHPHSLARMFKALRYVVVDEIHAFLGTERGVHLRSLISRLVSFSAEPVRIVGLSATIGDIGSVKCWIDHLKPDDVNVVRGRDTKEIRYLMKGYLRGAKQHGETSYDRPAEPSIERSGESNGGEPVVANEDFKLAQDLIREFYGKTALVFCNSRSSAEFWGDLLSRCARSQGMNDPFLVHHGSLAKGVREQTEEMLRSDVPAVALCTSSLELGIDVGNIVQVGHIGAPWSVASLRQRLGRSGRQDGKPCVLIAFIAANAPCERTSAVEHLFPEVLRGVALTELMIQGWTESPRSDRLHFSTLAQQVMSTIAQLGGAHASDLYEGLVRNGAFFGVSQAEFTSLLRGMGAADLLEQTAEGLLILGLKGERIVRSLEFYSAFAVARELRVTHAGNEIGTIAALPGLGSSDYIILAGRRWHIVEVDFEREEILVEPSSGGRLPPFESCDVPDVHPVVSDKMREILARDSVVSYLDDVAADMLDAARRFSNSVHAVDGGCFADGRDTVWFTWAGSAINRTLQAMALREGLECSEEFGIALAFEDVSLDDVRTVCSQALDCEPLTADDILKAFPIIETEKYDRYLPRELLIKSFMRNYLDIDGTQQFLTGMAIGGGRSESVREHK